MMYSVCKVLYKVTKKAKCLIKFPRISLEFMENKSFSQ